jgi:hypothetical protein
MNGQTAEALAHHSVLVRRGLSLLDAPSKELGLVDCLGGLVVLLALAALFGSKETPPVALVGGCADKREGKEQIEDGITSEQPGNGGGQLDAQVAPCV